MTARERPEQPLPGEYLPATGAARAELVLLHGWGGDREVWRRLLREIRPWAGVTLLDIPGCARGLGGENAPDLDNVLAAILDAAPEEAVYLGYSLGGQLALALAARAPERVRAVATVCSNLRFVAAGDWPGMAADTFRAFREVARVEPGAALRRFESLQVEGAEAPRALLRALRATRMRSAGRRSAESHLPAVGMLAGLDWLAELDLREAAGAMAAPRLHLLAERDALVPVEAAAAMRELPHDGGPEPRVEVLRGCCHLAPLDRPAEVARALEAFLDERDLRAPPAPRPAGIPKAAVAASFGRAAAHYDSAARLQREVGADLLEELGRIRREPRTVLDLGCGTGLFTDALREHFPAARHLGLDLAEGMVRHARERRGAPGGCFEGIPADARPGDVRGARGECLGGTPADARPGDVRGARAGWLVADAEALPLAAGSVGLIFSSLTFQWCGGVEHLFAEIARVLQRGGKCVFTTLGPGTLHELRAAWAEVDAHQHVNDFVSSARLASAMAAAPDLDMVLEARTYRLTYPRVRDLLDELKGLGAHNMNPGRPAGMTSRRSLQQMLRAYEQWRTDDGLLPATWEVIFGTVRRL
ncbi:MAG: malonyl-ACP O-methyltransferase BioC [Halioglobus sp.]|nr:malonyl-ACP O-methyltransferase BioC [Halioglobus sp.]